MSLKKNIEDLVNIYQRRLQKLKEQEATYGANTPPEILIQIEDIEGYIFELQKEVDQPDSIYQLTGTSPHKNRITKRSEPTGNYHHIEQFTGAVHPEYPENGVWIIRLLALVEPKKDSEAQEINEYSVYRAERTSGNSWRADVRLHLWHHQLRSEYMVWAVVPDKDALLLFEYFESNHQKIAKLEKTIGEKRYNLRLPWLQLPANPLPDFLASTQETAVRIVLSRNGT